MTFSRIRVVDTPRPLTQGSSPGSDLIAVVGWVERSVAHRHFTDITPIGWRIGAPVGLALLDPPYKPIRRPPEPPGQSRLLSRIRMLTMYQNRIATSANSSSAAATCMSVG